MAVLGVGWQALLVASLAMVAGGVMQAAIGLGFALVAIPVIALVEPRFIPGPILIAGMVMVVVIAVRSRAEIVRAELGVGVIGLALGTAIGAAGLWLMPTGALRYVFGVLILAAVAVSLLAPPIRLTRGSLFGAGTVAGVMGTMAGMHGPPLGLVYQHEGPARTRVMLSTFFIPATWISVAALALLGRFGGRDILLGLLLVPGALAGLALGPLAARYLDRTKTRYAILAIATASAVALMI